MSGGQLVVVDRAGRDARRYPLAGGMATLGSAAGCDIRVMLPCVRAHHATVSVHAHQTVIRNVGEGVTLVNERSVSVAALRHGDVITLGDRCLRWEYSNPTRRHQVSPGVAPLAAGAGASRGARGGRRATAAAPEPTRDRAVQLAIEMTHRASMPASSGGKQVAIVQPQRRDTSEPADKSPTSRSTNTSRSAPSPRRAHPPAAPAEGVPADTTKATLWIESRKRGGRGAGAGGRGRRSLPAKRSTPLRLAVLKRAQSAHKPRVVKIEAPLKIDHTKQAAIMLMTGHAASARLSLPARPSYVLKRPSPRPAPRQARRGGGGKPAASVPAATTSGSPGAPPGPRKSALKDHNKKTTRKNESIKFDLSHLDNEHSRFESDDSEHLTLHYSEDSGGSPSPRKSINSRSGRMLQRVGTSLTQSPARSATPARAGSLTPNSPRRGRGGMMVRKALDTDHTDADLSADTTVASAFQTRTLSPRTRNMESYSIVDLVSLDSNDASKSVYDSADSTNATDYETPNASRRNTRSTMNPTLLGSSTPFVAHARATRSRSNPNVSKLSTGSSVASRRSKSLSTPDNKHISVNSTRVSRASRSRSRISDGDLVLLDDTEVEDSSPKTSRRTRTRSNIDNSKMNSMNSPAKDGISTPENRHSPVDVGTPVLSIQSLLETSQSSHTSRRSAKRGRKVNYNRKTMGAAGSEPKKRPSAKSKSLGGISARRTKLRLSKDSELSDRTDAGAPRPDNDDTVTPKSAVKLVPETVKHKHSTAKKPQSKRSIIDDLNQSDIVKQLFNSPVKRKLSQSMTEFSRKNLFDDEEIVIAKRPTRHTIALGGAESPSPEPSETFTPERFVSPIGSDGSCRSDTTDTPDNDRRSVRGVRSLLRTHRTRKTANNDLTDVRGLKLVFAKAPRDRLSDVRIKELFQRAPENDLRRVSRVKSLFRRENSPKNDLTDVGGVKKLFRKSPNNDLRNVSGVKRTLRKNSPKNDLTDVSGIEELFNYSNQSSVQHSESLFDQWVGKPAVRSVYSKTFSTKLIRKPKNRRGKTLHNSLDVITNNVEEWLNHELQSRFRSEPSTSKPRKSLAAKELQKLMTSTVEGGEPVRGSRTRGSLMKKSASETYDAHTLPIKKRSLAGAGAAEGGRGRLPLKKRAVVHSTPVKGRLHVTMNASELGRVSPITLFAPVAPDTTTETGPDATVSRTTRRTHQKSIHEEKQNRSKTTTTAKPETPIKTSAKKEPPKSPPAPLETPPKRATRNRKITATVTDNPKKRRNSFVITKKPPVMSPKAEAKSTKRATRARTQPKVQTPKRTRVRAQKVTVAIPKPSPKLKPQAKGKVNSKVDLEKSQTQVKQTRRTRKNTAATESPEESQVDVENSQTQVKRTRRTRKNTAATETPEESQPKKTLKNEPKGKENKTDNVPKQPAKRGRKAAEIEPTSVTARQRGRAKDISVPVKPRGASVTMDIAEDNQPKTRRKRVEKQESVQSEPTTRRRRNNTANATVEQPKSKAKPAQSEPKSRGKKVETQSEPVTRGRRTRDNSTVLETKGRKRKSPVVEEIPPKVAKRETKRGRKAETAEPKETVTLEIKETRTRGRPKKEVLPQSVKKTRGKKAAEPKASPAADKRKRNTKVEAAPTKGKKPTAAETSKARTRGKAGEESAAGRSRRR